MDDFDKIKAIVEQEAMAILQAKKEHPERHSAQGRIYWDGNWAALRWVVLKMEEIRPSGKTAK